MEYEKISKLLDDTSNKASKFRTKTWVEINDVLNWVEINSDAYILVKEK